MAMRHSRHFLNSAGTATLNPGDLLFGLGGSIFFGIPLVNHNGLTAGHLYGDGVTPLGTQTAQQVLNDAATIYRFNWPVWLAGGSLPQQGTVVSFGATNGTGPEVIVTSRINFDASSVFLLSNQQRSAVCVVYVRNMWQRCVDRPNHGLAG